MLKASKFERIRKFRVSDHRVFFAIESGDVEHEGHIYQGTLFILDIRARKDAY
jgi:hypothetical protein